MRGGASPDEAERCIAIAWLPWICMLGCGALTLRCAGTPGLSPSPGESRRELRFEIELDEVNAELLYVSGGDRSGDGPTGDDVNETDAARRVWDPDGGRWPVGREGVGAGASDCVGETGGEVLVLVGDAGAISSNSLTRLLTLREWDRDGNEVSAQLAQVGTPTARSPQAFSSSRKFAFESWSFLYTRPLRGSDRPTSNERRGRDQLRPVSCRPSCSRSFTCPTDVPLVSDRSTTRHDQAHRWRTLAERTSGRCRVGQRGTTNLRWPLGGWGGTSVAIDTLDTEDSSASRASAGY